MDKLPPLNAENSIRIQTLMELFEKQLWSFAEFLNEAPDRIETYKYVDFILYALKKDLDAKHPPKHRNWIKED